MFSGEVCYAAGELVQVEARLRTDGGFKERADLADLDLQLAQELRSPALGADHVAQDRPFRASRHQGLGHPVHVDERAPPAAAILFYRDEGGDPVGPDILAETQGNDAVWNYLHVAWIITWRLVRKAGIFTIVRLPGRTRRLTGDRVELRRHSRWNYPLYAEWYGDPEVWRLTSWAAAPLEPRAVERLFEEREGSATDDSFAIHLKGEKRPIGVISLMNISEAKGSADLSVIVGHPEDRHHGYGAEAIDLIVDYAFRELGLESVALSVFDFNEDAISTYERLGFRPEGRVRQAVEREGEFHDAILMRITRREP